MAVEVHRRRNGGRRLGCAGAGALLVVAVGRPRRRRARRQGGARRGRRVLGGGRAEDRRRTLRPQHAVDGERKPPTMATRAERDADVASRRGHLRPDVLHHLRDDRPERRAAEVHHAGREDLRPFRRRVVGHLGAFAGPKMLGMRARTRVAGGEPALWRRPRSRSSRSVAVVEPGAAEEPRRVSVPVIVNGLFGYLPWFQSMYCAPTKPPLVVRGHASASARPSRR